MRISAAQTPADFDGVVHILSVVSGVALTAEEVEHGIAEPGSLLLVARDGDDVVGSGLGKRSSTAGSQYTMIRVLPETRNRGVGQRLYEELSAHGRAQGLQDMWGRVRGDDAASLAFAANRGFVEFSREVQAILALTPLAEEPPPPGIDLTTLADRPDLAVGCYAVDLEAVPDIPAQAEFEAYPYDTWRAQLLEGPGALPHLCVVALEGAEVVGYTGLLALQGDPGTAENQLTGVRRAWRGRGIAYALKREQARRAHAAGFRRITTYNDEVNAPMRAVNARLGFEPQPPALMLRGPFA